MYTDHNLNTELLSMPIRGASRCFRDGYLVINRVSAAEWSVREECSSEPYYCTLEETIEMIESGCP